MEDEEASLLAGVCLEGEKAQVVGGGPGRAERREHFSGLRGADRE